MTVVSALAVVIAARNPVHSVLFLILDVLQFRQHSSCSLGAEFLAMVLVVVYVGAVAVLVSVRGDDARHRLHPELKRKASCSYLPIGGHCRLRPVAIELTSGHQRSIGRSAPDNLIAIATRPTRRRPASPTPQALGRSPLHQLRPLFFQIAGMILLDRHDRRHRFDACASAKVVKPTKSIGAQLRAHAARQAVELRRSSPPGRGALEDDMTIGLGHYLTVAAAILFTIGMAWAFFSTARTSSSS